MATDVVSKVGIAGGSTRDYSSLQAWEDACPADITTTGSDINYIAECYNDGEFTAASGTIVLNVAGTTTDSTHWITVRPAAGQSFYDNPGFESTPLRYNAANGVAIRGSGGANAVYLGIAFVKLQGLQMTTDGITTIDMPFVNSAKTWTRCIIDGGYGSGGSNYTWMTRANGTTVDNCVFINNSTGTFRTINADYTTLYLYNCTLIAFGNTAYHLQGPSTFYVYNSAFVGGTSSLQFDTRATTNGSGNYLSSGSAIGGTNNMTNSVYNFNFSGQFQNISRTTVDARLVAGSSLIDNANEIDNSYPVSISGLTRTAGSYDVGAYEYKVPIIVATGTVQNLGVAPSSQGNSSSTPNITQLQVGATTNQNLAPDAIAASANLTGTVTAVQDSPSSPDANWLTTTSTTAATNNTVRLTFPTPTVPLKTGAGLQTFNVYWRKNPGTSGTNTVTATVSLYENGVLKGTASAAQTVSSTTGSTFAFTWDASLLSDPTGAGVEIYIAQTGGISGSSSKYRYLEVGSVQWVATSKAADTPITLTTNNLGITGSSQSNGSTTPAITQYGPGYGTTVTLTGDNSAQSAITSTGAITIANNLAIASSTEANGSSTGVIYATQILVGAGSSQSGVSGTGAVGVVTAATNLTADGSSQSSTSDAVAISQTVAVVVNLTADGSSQSASSGTGSIARTVGLTGTNSSESNTSSTGVISATQNLIGANSTQANASSTGVITKVVSLTGTNSNQNNASSTSAVTLAVALTGATSVQSNASSTGTATASQNLAVAPSTQSNSSAIGTVTCVVGLVGTGSSQANTSSTGTVSLAIPLTGTNSSQSNNASTVNISQVQNLVGTSSGQANTSNTGTITRTVTLTTASSNQSNASSTGSLSAAITLTASGSSQGNNASTGAIAQAVNLAVANSGQGNVVSTGTVSQTQNLVVSGSSQAAYSSTGSLSGSASLSALYASQGNASSTGSIAQVQNLAGSGSSQASGSSTGSIAVTRSLTGTNSNTSNTASTASVTVVHVLVGTNSVEASVSSTGSVAQVQQLAIASAGQNNTASTGSVASNAVVVNLTGANSSASSNSGVVAIVVSHNLQVAGSTALPTSSGVAVTSVQMLGLASSVQSNLSSTGLISRIVSLVAAASQQANSTAVSLIAQIQNLVASSAAQGSGSSSQVITSIQYLYADGVTQGNASSSGAFIKGALIVIGDVLVTVEFDPYDVQARSDLYLVSVNSDPYAVAVSSQDYLVSVIQNPYNITFKERIDAN